MVMNRVALFILLFLAITASARAVPSSRGEYGDEIGSTAMEDNGLRPRKTHSFFHRPDEETPAGQFARAEKARLAGKLRRASADYLALVHEWADSPEAPAAQLWVARLLLERRKFEQAFNEYQYLVDYFPAGVPYDEVLSSQFKIANILRTEKTGGFLFIPGVRSPERAVPMYEQIIKNAPNGEKAAECQFMVGVIHEELEEYEEGYLAYEKVGILYPSSEFAASALYRRAYCLYKVAELSPRDEHQAQRALVAFLDFLRQFPGDANAAEAEQYRDKLKERLSAAFLGVAEFYDYKARNPRAAAVAYADFLARFPTSDKVASVQKRIAELERTLAPGNVTTAEGTNAPPR